MTHIQIEWLGNKFENLEEVKTLEETLQQLEQSTHIHSDVVLSIPQPATQVKEGLVRTEKFVNIPYGWRAGKYNLVHPPSRSEVLIKYYRSSDDEGKFLKTNVWQPEPTATYVTILPDHVCDKQGNEALPQELHYLLDNQRKGKTPKDIKTLLHDLQSFADQGQTELFGMFCHGNATTANWEKFLHTPAATKNTFTRW